MIACCGLVCTYYCRSLLFVVGCFVLVVVCCGLFFNVCIVVYYALSVVVDYCCWSFVARCGRLLAVGCLCSLFEVRWLLLFARCCCFVLLCLFLFFVVRCVLPFVVS